MTHDAEEASAADRRGVFLDVRPLNVLPFRRLWIGQVLSILGSVTTSVVVSVQLYAFTGSSLAVGLVGVFEAVPLIVLGIVGGGLADRYDRRKLALIATLGMTAVSAGLLVQQALDLRQATLLYALVAAQSALSAVESPATRSLLPQLVGEKLVPAAAALTQASFQLALVVGPLLAGVALALGGVADAYLFDMGTFVVAALATWALPRGRPRGSPEPTDEAAPSAFSELLQGLRFTWRAPRLRAALILDLGATVFGMPFALFPAIAQELGHPAAVGALYSAPAIGGVVAVLLSGWVVARRSQLAVMVVAVAVFGVAVLGFGLSDDLRLSVGLLAVAGGGDAVSGICRSTLLLAETPEHLLGRVNALGFVVGQAGPSLGHVEAGVVAGLRSAEFSAVSGALGTLAVTAAVGAAGLRRLGRVRGRER